MATGNWTDPNCGQLQLVVRSFAVGFSSVSIIFSVQWTGPANTRSDDGKKMGADSGCIYWLPGSSTECTKGSNMATWGVYATWIGCQSWICQISELCLSSISTSCLLVFRPFDQESSHVRINLKGWHTITKYQDTKDSLLVLNIKAHWKKAHHSYFVPRRPTRCK